MSDTEAVILNNATRLIHPETMEYGITVQQAKSRCSGVIWGAITEEVMAYFGYLVIQPTERPVNDVVYETTPTLVDGVFQQTWMSRAFNAQELKNNFETVRSEAIHVLNINLAGAIERGYPYNFGTDEEPNVQHIQLRDGDRANHAGMAGMHARDPNRAQVFRTYENNIVPLNAEQVVSLTDAAYSKYLHLLGKVWALKDLIGKAESAFHLPPIPQTLQEFYTDTLEWEWVEPQANAA